MRCFAALLLAASACFAIGDDPAPPHVMLEFGPDPLWKDCRWQATGGASAVLRVKNLDADKESSKRRLEVLEVIRGDVKVGRVIEWDGVGVATRAEYLLIGDVGSSQPSRTCLISLDGVPWDQAKTVVNEAVRIQSTVPYDHVRLRARLPALMTRFLGAPLAEATAWLKLFPAWFEDVRAEEDLERWSKLSARLREVLEAELDGQRAGKILPTERTRGASPGEAALWLWYLSNQPPPPAQLLVRCSEHEGLRDGALRFIDKLEGDERKAVEAALAKKRE